MSWRKCNRIWSLTFGRMAASPLWWLMHLRREAARLEIDSFESTELPDVARACCTEPSLLRKSRFWSSWTCMTPSRIRLDALPTRSCSRMRFDLNCAESLLQQHHRISAGTTQRVVHGRELAGCCDERFKRDPGWRVLDSRSPAKRSLPVPRVRQSASNVQWDHYPLGMRIAWSLVTDQTRSL